MQNSGTGLLCFTPQLWGTRASLSKDRAVRGRSPGSMLGTKPDQCSRLVADQMEWKDALKMTKRRVYLEVKKPGFTSGYRVSFNHQVCIKQNSQFMDMARE